MRPTNGVGALLEGEHDDSSTEDFFLGSGRHDRVGVHAGCGKHSAAEVGPELRVWPSNCSHGYFCAYAGNSYSGGQLLSSRAASGSNAVEPSQRDSVSSAANRTTNKWLGKDKRTGQPDPTLITFAAGSGYETPGSSWNDKIDHFDVR